MPKDNSKFFEKKNEWSIIKDRLLGCYLTPYFQKVLMTGKPIFYVDCFAGKGKFADGNDGSPLIALRIREQCLEHTTRTSKDGAIQTCFIELNHAGDLKNNIGTIGWSYDQPYVISGKYENNIEDCLQQKQGYNVFLYIDPYGIKALDFDMFQKFRYMGFNTFEMLINFNSFGFFRDACRVLNVDYRADAAFADLDDLIEYEPTAVAADIKSENMLTNIAGGEYWKGIVNDYKLGRISGYKAEQRLSTEYKQHLKQVYSYVLDMPIRLKAGQRPKYRMIHVCDHEDGCFLMAQNIQRRTDELFVNIQQGGQISLFDNTSQFTSSVEDEVLTRSQVVTMVKDCLDKCPKEISITKFIAKFMNANGLICQFNMIYEILSEMESKQEVTIRREPPLTQQNKPSSFWEESKDHSVYIRRLSA